KLLPKRPLLAVAVSGNIQALEQALRAEEIAERERDHLYWIPLKKEIERLRHQQMRTKGVKDSAVHESSDKLPKYHDTLISAINDREVLKFSYEGLARSVEPQTY